MTPMVFDRAPAGETGFSLVEVLVAVLLTLLLVGAALWLLRTETTLAEGLPQAADLQQRGRLAVALLAGDLARAGTGPAVGRLAGPLSRSVPAVLPRRIGLMAADPVSSARADVISILWAADPRRAAETAVPVSGDTPVLSLASTPGCGASVLCGLSVGARLLNVDESGRSGLYVITAEAGANATLRALQSPAPSLPAGAVVLAVDSRTYVFDAPAHQLRAYDAYLSDAATDDEVVGMEVEYLGDAHRPSRPKPANGSANCAFDASGTFVAAPAPLPLEGASLAVLPLDTFTDGPWCGEGGAAFDLDLLRVRAVRVRLRLQAALDPFRGSGSGFLHPGTNTRPLALVPDLTIATEVTPSNLNIGR